MPNYSDDRIRLIEYEMRRNGGDRVMAELTTRSADHIREAGLITLTGGRGGAARGQGMSERDRDAIRKREKRLASRLIQIPPLSR